MKEEKIRVAVCSRSFSRHEILRKELLDQYPNTTFNDAGEKLHGARLVEFLAGHDRAIVALESINSDILERLPNLRVISKYGVGLDMLDLEEMARRNVLLGWTPGVNRYSVAELVLGFIFSVYRGIGAHTAALRSGEWRNSPGRDLFGATVGIVGLGHVGRALVEFLQPFGVNILANDIVSDSAFCERHGVKMVTFEYLVRNSDIVSIHLPLTTLTRNLFDRCAIQQMKKTAVLVNTSRGGIVDESAVVEALQAGTIGGAGFDVFLDEPLVNREFVELPTVSSTPHIGGSTANSIVAMGRAAIEGLADYGNPLVVSLGPDRG